MLSNLVYVSLRNSNCTSEEIDKILESCKRNNGDLNITGVLLYSDRQFVQYLEGEYQEIFSLYDKIKQDDRHKNVVLITSGAIEKRLFPSWQMAAKKVDFDSVEFRTQITEEEKDEFNKILSGEESTNALDLLKKVFK